MNKKSIFFLNKKNIFNLVLILVILLAFVRASEVLSTEEESIKEKTIIKTKYTASTEDTEYSDGTHNLVLYSGRRFIEEDNKWKKIEEAKSLMGAYKLVIDEDKKYPVKVIDYNYTSMTIDFNVADTELNKDIPIKVYNKNNEIDLSVSIPQVKFNSKTAKRHILTIPKEKGSILGQEIKWGEGSTTINFSISTSSDDAEEKAGSTATAVNGCDSDAVNEYCGFRWAGVTIPNGATINTAYFNPTIYYSTYDEPNHNITFEDALNPPTFSTGALNVSNRIKTSNNVTWSSADLGCPAVFEYHRLTSCATFVMPDLSSIVQELVDSYDYSSGSSMVLIIQGSADASRDLDLGQYDSGVANSAWLNITYTAASGDTTIPSFSLNSTNASSITYNGTDIQINLTIKDDSNISAYTLSHNDTGDGTWKNETIIHLNPSYNVSMVWNYSIVNFSKTGGTMGWKVWANDTLNNINISDIYTFLVQSASMSIVWLNTTTITIENQSFAIMAYNVSCNGTCGNVNVWIDPPISDCDTLEAAGIYTLTQDVKDTSTCFNITVDDVTLDCKGYEINYSSDGTVGYGVHADTVENATVQNCIIKEGSRTTASKHSIWFEDSKNVTIFNNTIRSVRGNSIYFLKGANNTILNNTVVTDSTAPLIDGGTIYLYATVNSILRGNKVNSTRGLMYSILSSNIGVLGSYSDQYNHIFGQDNLAGGKPVNYTYNVDDVIYDGVDFTEFGLVIFAYSRNITIRNSNFSNGGLSLFFVNESEISNNFINTSNGHGIYLSGKIKYNNISNNDITVSKFNSDGIQSGHGCNFNLYSYNKILVNDGKNGIFIDTCINDTISHNTITTTDDNHRGIYVGFYADDNNVLNNIVNGTGDGIDLVISSDYNNISNNDITSTGSDGEGVYLYQCYFNSILNNTIKTSGNTGSGLRVQNSHNNTFKNNGVTSINSYSILLDESISNNFYNNLFNSTSQVSWDSAKFNNSWNTTNQTGTRIYKGGTNIGGNYWTNPSNNGYSDTCTDSDSDGFCDTAFNTSSGNGITGTGFWGNIDYLPLSDEFSEPSPPSDKGGLIPNSSGNPFYLDISVNGNPANIYLENNHTIVYFKVYANGTENTFYNFFAYANSTDETLSSRTGYLQVNITEEEADSCTYTKNSNW